MFQIIKINKYKIDENLKFINFFNKKFYGVNDYFILKFKKRFEFFFLKKVEESNFSNDQTLQIIKFLIQMLPLNLNFLNKNFAFYLYQHLLRCSDLPSFPLPQQIFVCHF